MSFRAGLLGLVGLATAAHAQPVDSNAGAAYADGQRRYAAGDYAGAAERFKAAYAFEPDPVYLFNIAQASRLGKACQQAVDYYQKFLDAVPTAPNADKVRKYVVESRACVEGSRLEPAPVDPPVAPVASVGAAEPVASSPIEDGGRGKRRVAIGLAIGGVAALGVAGYFTYDVHSLESDRASVCTGGCIWNTQRQARVDDLQRRGDRASVIAVVSYATGAAAIVTGVALYLAGQGERADRVSVVPTAGGGMVIGRFEF